MHWVKVKQYQLQNSVEDFGFYGLRNDGAAFNAIGPDQSSLDRWLKADYKKSLESGKFVPIEEES